MDSTETFFNWIIPENSFQFCSCLASEKKLKTKVKFRWNQLLRYRNNGIFYQKFRSHFSVLNDLFKHWFLLKLETSNCLNWNFYDHLFALLFAKSLALLNADFKNWKNFLRTEGTENIWNSHTHVICRLKQWNNRIV